MCGPVLWNKHAASFSWGLPLLAAVCELSWQTVWLCGTKATSPGSWLGRRPSSTLDWQLADADAEVPQVHVPAVLDAPGMIAARRLEQIHTVSNADSHNRPRIDRKIYEMAEASVIRHPETLEASVRGACPAELEPHRQASYQVYAEVFQQTGAR